MDSWSVVGATASIVSLVDFGLKVCRRLNDYNDKVQNLPGTFRALSEQLPLIVDTVSNIRQNCELNNIDISESTLRALVIVIQGLRDQIHVLNDMLDKITTTPDDSVWDRHLKMFRSLRLESDVNRIYTVIRNYRDTLLSYQASRYQGLAPVVLDPDFQPIIEFPDTRQSPAFVGREDILSAIEHHFDNDKGSPRKVVLRAMGGQGKTQVALRFCQQAFRPDRAGNRRYHAIFWVDASTEGTVRKSFKNIRAAVEKTSQQTQIDEEDGIMYVKRIMKTWSFPWLIVFDNYDNPAEFGIADYMPFGVHGAILITTRHEDVGQWGRLIDVPGLPEDDALILLMEQCRVEEKADNLPKAQEIVKRLGYLALAIHQAAAYIWKHPPIHSFLATYETQKKNVMKWTPSVWVYRHTTEKEWESALSVFTTWELSISQITDHDTRKRAERFLTVCAYLGKSNISEDLIKLSYSEPEDWMKLFLHDGKWNSTHYSGIVIKLRELALVQAVSGDSNDFSIHPMVADWLKCRGEDSTLIKKQQQQQRDRASAATLLKNFLQLQVDSAGSPHGYMDMPLEARGNVLLQVTSCEGRIDEFLALDIGSSNWEAIYSCFSELHESVGDYSRALLLQEEVVQRRQNKYNPDHPLLLASQRFLGRIYLGLGKFQEAENCLRNAQARDSLEDLVKGDISALDTADILVKTLVCQAKFEEAEGRLAQLIKIKKELYGESGRPFLRSRRMLAWLLENDGELERAETLLAHDLRKCEEQFEAEDLDTLTTYNAYAVLSHMKGDLIKAEELSRKAVQGRARRLGPTHPSTLNALTNMSMVLASQTDKSDEGLELARKVLSLRQQKLGDYHIATLVSIVNLIRILESLDTHNRANQPEIRQLKDKLERALEQEVWGASMLDYEVRPRMLTGDSQVLPVSRISNPGFRGQIRDQRHSNRTRRGSPARIDPRILQSAMQQQQ
ncbi:hypothetical protein BDW68DRAFT_182990 [Aspergillus falconensis]